MGRGGAGNYYTQEEREKALKNTEVGGGRPCIISTICLSIVQDVEAQRPATGIQPEDIEQSKSEYVHSGRGGAGNYANATEIAEATIQTADVNPSLKESKLPRTGYYGRGGAGNYRAGEAETKEKEEMESALQEQVHQQIVRDVEAGLKEPEKAHLGGEKLGYDNPR